MKADLLFRVIKLCAFPAGSMLGGFLVASMCRLKKPGHLVTSGMPYFGAGVVFCAIAVETVPYLMVSGPLFNSLMIFLGAVVGILFTLGLGTILDLGDNEDDYEEEDERTPTSRGKSQYEYGSTDTSSSSSRHWKLSPRHDEDILSIPYKYVPRRPRAIPWGLMAAVAVDAIMDGLLIGISTVTGWRSDEVFVNERAGMIMTLALTIQLGFLGVYSAGTIQQMGVTLRVLPIYSILPICVLLGGVCGAFLLSSISGAWYLFVISFGTAALIYLVTEELLIETQAQAMEQSPETWVVTLQFISGFLCLLMCKQIFAPISTAMSS